MLLEMHSHTLEYSACSHVSAVELVRRVLEKGLQGIVLTDHHHLWSEVELESLRREAGVPDYFLLLSGQELTTRDLGDVLVYGASDTVAAGTPLAEVRRYYPDAALVWAHPYRKGRTPSTEALSSSLLDGVEIFNSNQTMRENSRGLRDWHRVRFTALAGTDTHGPRYAGLYPTLFDHPVKNIDDLAHEIRKGRCRPFFREISMFGSRNRVTEVTIGSGGVREIQERFIIKALDSPGEWHSAERAYRLLQALNRTGFPDNVFRIPQTVDEDPESMTIIEQSLEGEVLYDQLLKAAPSEGRACLQLAARWLARLHNLRVCLTPSGEFLEREPSRIANYLEAFTRARHPYASRMKDLAEAVREREEKLVRANPQILLQGHGDYHPKNILIGRDSFKNVDPLFIAAVDFESSFCLPPAFDVGYFLAQFRNMFFHHTEVLQRYSEDIFLSTYLEYSEVAGEGFTSQVELFRARANLSIGAYLVKLGLGKTENLWQVLMEAEHALLIGASGRKIPEE